MSTEVGSAYVNILPSTRGFAGALRSQLGGMGGAAGAAGGRGYGRGFSAAALPGIGKLAPALAALGIAGVVKSSIELEKTFSQTMATMGAVANVPQSEIKELSALATKMGADTSFSANEAADAMLELAKGGLSAAEIQAGALSGTLTLAAAGGTDLATASTIASNAMNTFGLKGKDMASIAAALAGGANASSASVESLGSALQQVGPGATNAGLSLQDTIGALSAFDAAGIKGSDAGTSLKTMLTRLVPMTDAAASKMEKLGLKFTDAQGKFLPIEEVAGKLQKGLAKLSDEKRTEALATMFGSDATRAATVLMKEGKEGIEKYIAAANDKGAAERVAAARTSGTAGALERLSGSIETAKLGLGRLFAPAVVAGADAIGKVTNQLSAGLDGLMSGGGGGPSVITQMLPKLQAFGTTLLPIVREGQANLAKLGGAAKAFAGAMMPVVNDIGGKLASVLGPALRDIGQMVTGQLIPAFTRFLPAITPVAKFLLSVIGGAVVGVLKGAVNVIKGVLNVVIGLFRTFSSLLTGDWKGAWDGLKQIASGILRALLGAFQIWWNGGILSLFKRAALFLTKGIWVGMWNGIKSIGTSAMSSVRGLLGRGLAAIATAFRAYIRTYVTVVRTGFTQIPRLIWAAIIAAKNLAMRALGLIAAGFRLYITAYRTAVLAGFNLIKRVVFAALSAVYATVTRVLSSVGSAFSRAWGALSGLVSRAWAAVSGAVTTGISRVVTLVRELPTKVSEGLGNIADKLVQAGKDLIDGFIRGIRDAAAGAARAAGEMAGDVVGAVKDKLSIFSPSKVMRGLGRNTGDGFAKGIADRKREAARRAREMAEAAAKAMRVAATNRRAFVRFGDFLGSQFVNGITGSAKTARNAVERLRVLARDTARAGSNAFAGENARLVKLVNTRATLMTKLVAAEKNLAAVRKSAAGLAQSVREGILGTGDVTQLGGNAETVIAGMTRAVAAAQTFARNIAKLRKRGLNGTALQQIIGAGVEGGGLLASTLAGAKTSELARINELQKALGKTATATGNAAAEAMYGAGIRAAQGLVEGLRAQRKAVEAQMLAIAKGMQAAIKRALGIKSPSTVFRNIGGNVGDGLALGILGGQSSVTDATTKLAGAATLAAMMNVPTLAGMPAVGGDGAAVPNVYVYIDSKEIESAVVRVTDQRDTALANGLTYRGS